MAGIKNDVLVGRNADFSQTNAPSSTSSENNGLVTNGQLWIGSTSTNAGGTHINVGAITSPDSSLTFGYSSPNITARVTNDLHVAKWIVNPLSNQGGNSTTIQNAINQAASGDTIFIYPGTYTENLTLKAGVNLTSFSTEYQGATTSQVVIVGKMTCSFSGTVVLSGITLQTNSDYVIETSGSNTGTLRLTNCNLFANNGSLIHSTNANFTCLIFYSIYVFNTTGITLGVFTGGQLALFYCRGQNPGLTTTASTFADSGITVTYSEMQTPITTSGTGSVSLRYTVINNGGSNATCVTAGGSGQQLAEHCSFFSGTASALSIGGSMTLTDCLINSSNTNAITGAGTIIFTGLSFTNTSNVINTTTQTKNYVDLGKSKASGQPAFQVYNSANVTNVTGDATVYTTVWDTEVFDLDSNFASNTFTAPITGKYRFSVTIGAGNLGAAHTLGEVILVTTARSYRLVRANYANLRDSTNNVYLGGSVIANMTAGDTATVTLGVNNSTKTVTYNGGSGESSFSGSLVC